MRHSCAFANTRGGLLLIGYSTILSGRESFFGQILFASRWLVQLIASERSGRSTVPRAFWWLSIIGGLITLPAAAGLAVLITLFYLKVRGAAQ